MVKRALVLALAGSLCAAATTSSFADPGTEDPGTPVAEAPDAAELAAQEAELAAAEAELEAAAEDLADAQSELGELTTLIDVNALAAARAELQAAIEQLEAAGDLTAEGAARLREVMDKHQGGLSQIDVQLDNLPQLNMEELKDLHGTAPRAYVPGVPAAPGQAPFAFALPEGASKLVIRLGDNGEVEVDGDNVPEERLGKIRERLSEGKVELREGVTIERSADGNTIIINGQSYDLLGLRGFATPALEGQRQAQVYRFKNLSEEERRKLEAEAKALAEQAPGAPHTFELRNGQPFPEAQSFEFYTPQHMDEMQHLFQHGQQFQLGQGWEEDLDQLTEQIEELVQQFMEEHEAAEPVNS
jgi:Skp family chaperone for outer membrane proteins